MEKKHYEILENMQESQEKLKLEKNNSTSLAEERKYSSYERNSVGNLKIAGTNTPILDSLKGKEGEAVFVNGNRDGQVICKGCKIF